MSEWTWLGACAADAQDTISAAGAHVSLFQTTVPAPAPSNALQLDHGIHTSVCAKLLPSEALFHASHHGSPGVAASAGGGDLEFYRS
jgi:hypothetical protein